MAMHLVFLHAFPLDEKMWEKQLSIAPGRSVAPTLYGFGDSLEDWAARSLEAVGTRPTIAIGASMGGSCAIEMARQAPEQIAGLVLVGAKAGHRPEPTARDAYIDTLRTDGVKGMWREISDWFSPTISQHVVDRIASIAFAQKADDLITAVRVFHGRPDLEYVVAQWEKPLLVVCGEKDSVATERKAIALSHLAPNGELHVMAECGHYMNMERPDEFNRVIADFVRRVDADQAA
jgi:pimeloyl-ACP methyl ester carboxylesterase